MVFRKQLGTILPLFAKPHPSISFLLLAWLSKMSYSTLATYNFFGAG